MNVCQQCYKPLHYPKTKWCSKQCKNKWYYRFHYKKHTDLMFGQEILTGYCSGYCNLLGHLMTITFNSIERPSFYNPRNPIRYLTDLLKWVTVDEFWFNSLFEIFNLDVKKTKKQFIIAIQKKLELLK